MQSLQLNLEGDQLFCLTEGKVYHEWPGYCNWNLFFLGVVAVMMLINPCRDMYDVIFDTKQDEDRSNLTFLLGAGISG